MISRSHAIRVLGVDPASAGATGFGVVESCGGRCFAVHYGALPAARRSAGDIPARLREIHAQTAQLIEKYQPTQIALEALFAALNVKTAIRLAEVRGVILLAAAQAEIPVRSYSPREVKVSIAGYGHASKEQIQLMVRALLALDETPQPADAADALAVALCHLRYAEMEAKFGVPAPMLPATRASRASASRAAQRNNSPLARVISAR